MTDKTPIHTPDAPAPAWAFHQAVRKGPMITVSGQGPVDPASGEYIAAGDVAAQTERTLQNVRAIVEAAGATFEDVLMLRVYLTERSLFPAMNEVYSAFMEKHCPSGVRPSRTTVFTGLPREEMLVEIDALAYRD
ncbi:RidA family protein [Ruania halotolerans]|uniref:RidA family protein n=1 Tax=Ruania halotolerans TaxID=2897773 RepID=UPI001E39706E|nr:RidA family protein [Ruania halotolerans]UFU05461.1 RidA family protein [Ruania halotolerans]